MSRVAVLSDEQWARIEPLLPVAGPKGGRPFREHRQVVEGIVYRYRTGIPWRDLPRETFGPWQTVWKRHRRLRERRITTVIPEPRDQQANRRRRGSAVGGRPANFDKVLYKRRNLVERSFLSTKHWRGLATRYDKLAIVYRGGAVLAAIITWLRT